MDPHILPTPGFDVPPQATPSASQAVNPNIVEPQQAQPSTPVPSGAVPTQAAPAPSSQPSAAWTDQNSVAPPVDVGGPMLAEDSDLIEKEWVQRAKAIVEQTREDPYRQNQEITKVKADYLKKRYNKDLKMSDE